MSEPVPAPPQPRRPPVRRWVVRGVWVALLAGLAALFVWGANRPDDPYLLPAERRPIDGFDEVAFEVDGPDAGDERWCALLADTPETRNQGLMGQQSLRGYDGMVFRFEEPLQAEFWMRDTPIPLSIAFFDADGGFVDALDMEPCPEDEVDCPLYGPDEPYLHAIEVPEGELSRLGIGPGSELSFPGGGCGAPS